MIGLAEQMGGGNAGPAQPSLVVGKAQYDAVCAAAKTAPDGVALRAMVREGSTLREAFPDGLVPVTSLSPSLMCDAANGQLPTPVFFIPLAQCTAEERTKLEALFFASNPATLQDELRAEIAKTGLLPIKFTHVVAIIRVRPRKEEAK